MKTLPPATLSPATFANFLRPDRQTRATQGNQLHQIADGVRNGSITQKEAQGLLQQQETIANAQRSAMADGKLDLGERFSLAIMQAQAQGNISSARSNWDMDLFAPMDAQAQRQGAQLDQIANGRTNNTITNREAGQLLAQQAEISGVLGNSDPWGKHVLANLLQSFAETDIARHSKPGTQFDPFRAGAAGVGGIITG
jgi:hypothetical protein